MTGTYIAFLTSKPRLVAEAKTENQVMNVLLTAMSNLTLETPNPIFHYSSIPMEFEHQWPRQPAL
jgi:hypothetical protein